MPLLCEAPTVLFEEGCPCFANKCDGRMGYAPVTDCTCFIAAPCGRCVGNPLRCDECGWNLDENVEDYDAP